MVEDQNWRFNSTALDQPYNKTLAIDTPESRRQFNQANAVVTAPARTNFTQTFQQNSPVSPSGTDWTKAFQPSWTGQTNPTSPSGTDWGRTFSPTPQPASTYTRPDLSRQDHETYGAGKEYGFVPY